MKRPSGNKRFNLPNDFDKKITPENLKWAALTAGDAGTARPRHLIIANWIFVAGRGAAS